MNWALCSGTLVPHHLSTLKAHVTHRAHHCVLRPQNLGSSFNPLPANASIAGTADRWGPALGHLRRLASPTVSRLLVSRIFISLPAFSDSKYFLNPIPFPRQPSLVSSSSACLKHKCASFPAFTRERVYKTVQLLKT